MGVTEGQRSSFLGNWNVFPSDWERIQSLLGLGQANSVGCEEISLDSYGHNSNESMLSEANLQALEQHPCLAPRYAFQQSPSTPISRNQSTPTPINNSNPITRTPAPRSGSMLRGGPLAGLLIFAAGMAANEAWHQFFSENDNPVSLTDSQRFQQLAQISSSEDRFELFFEELITSLPAELPQNPESLSRKISVVANHYYSEQETQIIATFLTALVYEDPGLIDDLPPGVLASATEVGSAPFEDTLTYVLDLVLGYLSSRKWSGDLRDLPAYLHGANFRNNHLIPFLLLRISNLTEFNSEVINSINFTNEGQTLNSDLPTLNLSLSSNEEGNFVLRARLSTPASESYNWTWEIVTSTSPRFSVTSILNQISLIASYLAEALREVRTNFSLDSYEGEINISSDNPNLLQRAASQIVRANPTEISIHDNTNGGYFFTTAL